MYRNPLFLRCNWLERLYYKHLRWFQKLSMVVIFSITSFVVLVALCAGLYETKSLILVILNWVTGFQTVGYVFYLIIFQLIIFYFIYLCLGSLFAMQVNGFPGFWPEGASSYSLLSISGTICCIGAPMCFYIIKMIFTNKKDYLEHTAFYGAFGDLTVVPILGVALPEYLPAV
jgi:hypothetical protein